jgi:hypothetical protein
MLAAAVPAIACRSPQAPEVDRSAEFLGARIPAAVAPGAGFAVVVYFGRGACEVGAPDVVQTPEGARIGVRVRPLAIPAGSACIAVLLRDSVVVAVGPSVTLPYTIRLQRPPSPDSVVIVRASTSAG